MTAFGAGVARQDATFENVLREVWVPARPHLRLATGSVIGDGQGSGALAGEDRVEVGGPPVPRPLGASSPSWSSSSSEAGPPERWSGRR